MPVNPQFGPMFLDGGGRWQVMCHDDCRSFEFPIQFTHEPSFARFMEPDGILGRKLSLAISDRGKVVDHSLRTMLSEPGLPFTVQLEIGPQLTAEKEAEVLAAWKARNA